MNVKVEITKLFDNNEKLKAFAKITFDEAFVIHSVSVINGSKGLFVSMPSKKNSKGEYLNVCHPTNKELSQRIQNEVLTTYNEKLKETEDDLPFDE